MRVTGADKGERHGKTPPTQSSTTPTSFPRKRKPKGGREAGKSAAKNPLSRSAGEGQGEGDRGGQRGGARQNTTNAILNHPNVIPAKAETQGWT